MWEIVAWRPSWRFASQKNTEERKMTSAASAYHRALVA
jgi:hypothetical protein